MNEQAKCLCALADRVRGAEMTLQGNAAMVTLRKAQDVVRSLEEGRRMNSLGELQGTGPALDVGIARLEEAVDAFRIAWTYLRPTAEDEDGWLEHTVSRSPRLQREVARLEDEASR